MSTAPTRPRVISTIAQLRSVVAAERAAGRSVALTPTMGALHDGHLAHVRRAAELADTRIVSIFVNPLQFGPSEDLARYPRTLDDDLDRLGALGVPFVFAPAVDEMYPTSATGTHVSPGEVGSVLEGSSRPGHFDGVLTVVAKLLLIVAPDTVTFGQKDAQQLFLVKRMVADLDFPVRVEVIETVRESDGLALSSRNRFLGERERMAALALPAALGAAAASAGLGLDAALASARDVLAGEPLVQLDYLTIVDPTTFLPADDGYRGPALALVAARVGSTRLIDNRAVVLAG